jgi:hypothetical protein
MRRELKDLHSHPGFTALATSRFISNVGNGISPVALAFGVLALPGATGKDLSIVMAARMFPMVALMLFGGVIECDAFFRGCLGVCASIYRSLLRFFASML